MTLLLKDFAMQTLPIRSGLKRCPSARSLATHIFPFAVFAFIGCGAGSPADKAPVSQLHLAGAVHGGQQPVANSLIQLYAVGSGGDGTASTPLISSSVYTDTNGGFTITGDYTCPVSNPEVYLVAEGGNPGLTSGMNNPAISLMAALGPCNSLSSSTTISMDEVTTVASVIPLAPYMSSFSQIASGTADASSLTNAFNQITQLVNISGGSAPGLVSPPNGYVVPIAEINTLANAIATCVNSDGSTAANSPCNLLFHDATPTGSSVYPVDTVSALINIGLNPTISLGPIFALPSPAPPFQPVLTLPPPDWHILPQPSITLTAASGPVGVGDSATGTITLAAPAPIGGLTVTLVSSDTTAVNIPQPALTVPSGSTLATFTYVGVTAGTAIITASAPDYASGSFTVTPTTQVLIIDAIATLAPNQVVAFPVHTAQNAAVDTPVYLTLSNPSQPNVVVVSPNALTIPAGSKLPTVQPQITTEGLGSVTVTATANGYASATTTINVSVSASFAAGSVSLTAGATTNETLTISGTAPQGGLILSVSSSNTAVATVPSTVTIPTGASSVNIPVKAIASGSALIDASAIGVQDASLVAYVSYSATATLPNSVTIPIGTTNETLSISSPAPAGGSVFTLSSSTAAVATVPTTVTIPAGATSVSVPVTGIASGQTTVSASAASFATVSMTVNVTGAIASPDTFTGIHLLNYTYFAPNQPLASPATFTVTSSNPAVLTVAKDGVSKGTASVSFTLTSQTATYFTLQGQAVGSATVTISAPGYTSAVANISVYQSGFGFSSGSGTTTTFSGPNNEQFYVSVLDPNTMYTIGSAILNPDLQPFTLTVNSSNPAVGTLSAPQFTNATYAYGSFNPVGPGTTTLTIVQPAGFTAGSYQSSITATVIQPQIGADSVTTAVHGQIMKSFDLGITPPSPVTATVTIADPTIALVTTDPTLVGSTSVSFPNVSYSQTNIASGTRQFWVQGQKLGTTTLTISAPGYGTATWVVTVGTGGFAYNFNGSVNVVAFGQQATGVLNLVVQDQYQYTYKLLLNPDFGALNVALVSSDTSVGTISTAAFGVAAGSAPITFTSGSKVGTTTLSITQPTGFMNTIAQPTVTATVSPAPIATPAGAPLTGVHVETQQSFSLPGIPPSGPVVVTVTASGGNVLLSSDPTAVGSASLQFTVSNTSPVNFYLQGEALGTGQLTFSATGYASTVTSYTVHNSSLVLCCSQDNSAIPENSYAPIALTITAEIVTDNLETSIAVPTFLAPDVGTLTLSPSSTGNGTVRPVNMIGGQSSVTTYFDAIQNPVYSTTLTLTQPSGFAAPPAMFNGIVTLIWTVDPQGVSPGIVRISSPGSTGRGSMGVNH